MKFLEFHIDISGHFISVMEPLLLEEFQRSKIPTHINNLMNVFEVQGLKPSKSDFLVGCIYICMLEYGFIPQEKENTYSDSDFSYKRIKELVSEQYWKKTDENTYNLSFILAPHHLYVCKVFCIKMGDDLVVNVFVRNIEDANYTVMLDVLSYYIDGMNQNFDIKKVQNLKGMSRLIKNQIAFPVKNAILHATGQRHPCLEDLPFEIIHYIFQYIHGVDIVRLSSTCKRFYAIKQKAELWEYLLKRDYNICMKKDDYKELFEKYGLVWRSKQRHNQEGARTPRYSYRI